MIPLVDCFVEKLLELNHIHFEHVYFSDPARAYVFRNGYYIIDPKDRDKLSNCGLSQYVRECAGLNKLEELFIVYR